MMSFDTKNLIPDIIQFVHLRVPGVGVIHRMHRDEPPVWIPEPLKQIYEALGNYPVPNNEQWRAPNWIRGLFGTQDTLLPAATLKNENLESMFTSSRCVLFRCWNLVF